MSNYEMERLNQVKVPLAQETVEAVGRAQSAHILFFADDMWRYDDFFTLNTPEGKEFVNLSTFIDALAPEIGYLDLRIKANRQVLANILGKGKVLLGRKSNLFTKNYVRIKANRY